MSTDREYENLVGAAILATDQTAKERSFARITCKLAASHRIFCGCGNVHDQKKIHVVEIVAPNGDEKCIGALCPKCYDAQHPVIVEVVRKAKAEYEANNVEPNVARVATWAGYFVIE
jgi:hypothetical protein